MKWLKGVSALEDPLKSSVLTIGNFDAVHLGHQELIDKVLGLSKKYDAPSVLMTFDPHPQKVLFPDRDLKRIFSFTDQREQVAKMGIDYYIAEPFSRALSSLSPEHFFVECIYKPLHIKALVVGYDFTFGANRQGTIGYLETLSKVYDFELITVPPYKIEGEVVSSSLIRKKIQAGAVQEAATLLGRPFYLEGIIEKGQSRGKQIGFPTANIYSNTEIFPKNGVYACNVYHKQQKYIGVTNVGKNPTFDEETKRPIQVECHILDFDKDIYGEDLRIELLDYVREEKKFSGVEELVKQIQTDVDYVRKNYL